MPVLRGGNLEILEASFMYISECNMKVSYNYSVRASGSIVSGLCVDENCAPFWLLPQQSYSLSFRI